MKQIIYAMLALQFICCNTKTKTVNAIATQVKIIHENGKAGYVTMNDSGEVVNKIAPVYDYLEIYISNTLGGVDLGKFYWDDRTMIDSEFVEFTPDPNNPEFVRDTVLINDTKLFDRDKLIIAKKNNKWGLLHSGGDEALPFQYDSIRMVTSKLDTMNFPLLVLIRNNRASIINQKTEILLSEELFYKYYPHLSLQAQLHLLEIAFVNNHLLVQQGGKFIDAIRKDVPPPSLLYECYFEGGKYNVVSVKTGKLLFDDWKDKILFKFTSASAQRETIVIDPTDKNTAMNIGNPFAKDKDELYYSKVEFIPSK